MEHERIVVAQVHIQQGRLTIYFDLGAMQNAPVASGSGLMPLSLGSPRKRQTLPFTQFMEILHTSSPAEFSPMPSIRPPQVKPIITAVVPPSGGNGNATSSSSTTKSSSATESSDDPSVSPAPAKRKEKLPYK